MIKSGLCVARIELRASNKPEGSRHRKTPYVAVLALDGGTIRERRRICQIARDASSGK